MIIETNNRVVISENQYVVDALGQVWQWIERIYKWARVDSYGHVVLADVIPDQNWPLGKSG
jgi:hypothetical protein